MSRVQYKNVFLDYDYTCYSWIISTKTGELIAKFTSLDKAKQFVDSLFNG